MPERLWQRIRHGLVRFRWPLIGSAAIIVFLACVFLIPQWLVDWELGASARTLTAADKAKAINDVRATLLQAIGGAVILLGAYVAYGQLQIGREQLEVVRQQAQTTAQQAQEQLQIAQQGQVTERFTRAIDQLGQAELDVRLGGIYALERIANDSPDDRATIAEVLTAYVRGHAPWPPRLEGQLPADAPIEQVPELQVRAADVQAALTVLARRQPLTTDAKRLDLHATDLRRAALARASLQGAYLGRSNLQGAIFIDAQLQKAMLNGAQLQEADLIDAQFQEANLMEAQLQGAHLEGADLQGAELFGAQLERADLKRANLKGARLEGADLQWVDLGHAWLQGADLEGANLRGAYLEGANLDGANLGHTWLQRTDLGGANLEGAHLEGANFQEARGLTGAQLKNAHADPETTWPTDFDPHNAGVVLIDRPAEAVDEPES